MVLFIRKSSVNLQTNKSIITSPTTHCSTAAGISLEEANFGFVKLHSQ